MLWYSYKLEWLRRQRLTERRPCISTKPAGRLSGKASLLNQHLNQMFQLPIQLSFRTHSLRGILAETIVENRKFFEISINKLITLVNRSSHFTRDHCTRLNVVSMAA